jgi:hypothetical protein
MRRAAARPAANVAAPPSPLQCNVLTLPVGTIIHRIHDAKFSAAQFNPGPKGNSRFAPITTASGEPIPTSYAATSFGCAAFETIFHDIDPDAPFKTVAWARIERLSYSVLALNRDMRLARFFSHDLLKWGCSRTQLIDTAPSTYPKTRLWSAAVHESDPTIDGMIWTSRKYDEEKAMVLFGTRFRDGDLQIRSSAGIVADPPILGELHRLARLSDILISR